MNKMVLGLIVLISTLLAPQSALCVSEGTYFKYMVNANSSVGDFSVMKGLALGYQSSALFLATRLEAGAYADQSNRKGARSSGFGFAGIGVQPEYGPLYVNFFQYVGLIGSPDTVLGGLFQFSEEAGIGIKDERNGTSVGLFYKHISNAGISSPNFGRDFVGIQAMIPW
jgi:hypothetical protein